MNIDNWNLFYKRSPDPGYHHTMCETNLMYTPYVSPDNKIMCMYWDDKSEYQDYKNRPLFNNDFLNYFFNKELENLELFKNKKYVPEVYDVDHKARKIFIEFSGETFNNIVYDENRNISKEIPNWAEGIQEIVVDIIDEDYYKASLYPHCFFISNEIIKTFDWYACYHKDAEPIDFNIIKGMIGKNSNYRFEEALTNNYLNFEIFFKRGIQQHIKWPENNPLPEAYRMKFLDGM